MTYAANSHSADLESSSNQYFSISDASQSGLDITGTITIEAWVKFESLPSNGTTWSVVTKDSGQPNRSYDAQVLTNPGGTESQIAIQVSSGGTNATTNRAIANLGFLFTTGKWYHLAWVYDSGSKTAKYYVNGTLYSPDNSAYSGLGSGIYNSSAPLQIGGPQSVSAYFDGKIDEVRIWSVERTSSQILENMYRQINVSDGLVASWHFDNALTDSTGNGNTLTNSGSTLFSAEHSPVRATRKNISESIASSASLQDDDELSVFLEANTEYIVSGTLFLTSSSADPDAKIGFSAPAGATMNVGYVAASSEGLQAVGERLQGSGVSSQPIPMNGNVPVVVHLGGTVKTSSTSGELILQWSQSTSNSAAVAVAEGSYIKVEPI